MPVKLRTRFYAAEVEGMITDRMHVQMKEAMDYASKWVKNQIQSRSHDGSRPSKPGQIPHEVSGALRRSIQARVEKDKKGKKIKGYLTVGTPYGLRLEFGFVGTDARGRKVYQAPRPFLRPAIERNSREIASILTGWKF